MMARGSGIMPTGRRIRQSRWDGRCPGSQVQRHAGETRGGAGRGHPTVEVRASRGEGDECLQDDKGDSEGARSTSTDMLPGWARANVSYPNNPAISPQSWSGLLCYFTKRLNK